jgi:hypothetical protein
VSEQLIQEQILYYRRRAPEYDATAHGPLAAPEVIERSLSDGTVHRVVKVFLDPPRLSRESSLGSRVLSLEVLGFFRYLGLLRLSEHQGVSRAAAQPGG